MDHLSLFTQLLTDSKTSKVTVKNYRADLNHFIKWYEKSHNLPFSLEKINKEVIDKYKTTSNMSSSSLKRRIAALKKYFNLLQEKNYSHNPFSQNEKSTKSLISLENVNNFLLASSVSNLTRKNYLSDIRQYITWAEKVASPTSPQHILNPTLLNEYSARLISLRTPTSTINRKISSLKKLADFAKSAGYISSVPNQSGVKSDKSEAENLSLSDIMKLNENENTYSKFPPIRLIQRLLSPYFELEDKIATSIALKLKSRPPKPSSGHKAPRSSFITHPEILTKSDTNRLLFAPVTPSSTNWLKKLKHHFFHSRPTWYKKYHSFTASHYLHFSLLLIASLAAAFLVYQYSLSSIFTQKSVLSASTKSHKILTFHGILSDSRNIPITEPTKVSFALYDDKLKNTPFWQGAQIITPDNLGNFTAYLGTQTPINQEIFDRNNSIYLGITLEDGNELRPRQKLPNVSYASNSEFLQGLAPITESGSGNKNVVLALDSSGNLTIPGESTTTFTSKSGNFKLTAESVILSSNKSSDGDIILSPDGIGKIDLQGPIINSSQNGAFNPGSVNILDSLVVTATGSATPAFAVLQQGTGDIFVASSAGNTNFVIDNKGWVGIGTDSPSEKLEVKGNILLSGSGEIHGKSLEINSTETLLLQANSTSGIGIGTSSPKAFVDIKGGQSSPLLNLNYTGSGDKIINIQNSAENVFTLSEKGNISLGTSSNSSKINLPTSISPSGGISFGDTNLYRSSTRTLSTDNSLEVEGDFLASGHATFSNVTLDLDGQATVNGVCHSGTNSDTTAYGRDLVACSNAPADIAEWYAAENSVQAGHIVALTDKIITYSSKGSDTSSGKIKDLGVQSISVLQKADNIQKAIGIVSTAPFKTIGSDIKESLKDNKNYKAVPLALAGRVLLKIAPDSPQIEPGDPLTLSRTSPGKGTKATSPSFIVARALEHWPRPEPTNQNNNEILVYIQPTWYQPVSLEGSTNTPPQNLSQIPSPNIIQNISHGAEVVFERIQTGSIIAQEIVVKNTLSASNIITSRLVAGLIEAKEITTDSIALTSDNLTITGKSLQEYVDERIIQAQNSQIAQGPSVKEDTNSSPTPNEPEMQNIASNPGNLITQSAGNEGNTTDKNATSSGEIDIEKLISDKMADLEENIASAASGTSGGPPLSDRSDEEPRTPDGDGEVTGPAEKISLDNLQTDSNGLVILPSHKSDFGIFDQSLTVYGTTTLNEATVLTNLTIGTGNNSLSIGTNSLNSLKTLEIQPLAQAPVSFMGGKLSIDTKGNLSVEGNAFFQGTLAARDGIFQNNVLTTQITTGIISPLPEHNLAIRLGEKKDGNPQQFQIQNSSGSAILSIDNKGNIESSGSATFSKLNFWEPEVAYAQISDTEIKTKASAGKASIKPYRRELTIVNPNVTKNSLIYLTPASNSEDKVIYLLRQVAENQATEVSEGSFTVGITKASNNEVEFNWLIVN